MKEIIQVSNPQEMINIGKKLAPYKKILLYGDLGSGKTVFVKGFCNFYGIDINLVQSPTYTYVNIYSNILHIDMYRIQSFSDLVDKGILDLINSYELVCIERPKREDVYGKDFLKVNIIKKGKKRILEINNYKAFIQ